MAYFEVDYITIPGICYRENIIVPVDKNKAHMELSITQDDLADCTFGPV